MTDVNQILLEAEEDLAIDYNGDLGKQTANQMHLFSKWTKRLKKETYNLKLMNIKGERLQSSLWLYYTGKAEPDVYKNKPMHNRFLKSETKEAIANDNDWAKFKVELIKQEEIVDALERTVYQIKDRGWAIKNIIDWKKFMSGD